MRSFVAAATLSLVSLSAVADEPIPPLAPAPTTEPPPTQTAGDAVETASPSAPTAEPGAAAPQPSPIVIAPPPPPAVVEARSERPRVLVMDLRNDGVDERIARTMADQLAVALEKNKTYDVVTSEDVRRVFTVEAQRREMGCNESGDSCLVEMANALGARFVLHGSIAQLGDVMVLNVSLFNAEEARSAGRETFEAKRVEELPAVARRAVNALTGTLDSGPSLAVVIGIPVASIGGLALLGGAVTALYGAGVASDIKPPPGGPTSAEKRDARFVGQVGFGVAVVGAVAAAVGIGVIFLLGEGDA